ncbi:MAG: hypothetical protein HKP09_05915, partial [Enterobacterales bacterium]|nr:hypothetical protein [Enterobacterales bacterium]
MLKTDFKPRKPRSLIFSEQKRFPVIPVILVVSALILIIWGISSQTNSDPSVSNGELKIVETETETGSETTDSKSPIKSYSIDLNLGSAESETTNPTPRLVKPKQGLQTKQATVTLPPEKKLAPEIKWVQTKIKRGDSTAKLFSRHGLSARELYEIMQLGKDTAILKRVQAGHVFEYSVESNGALYGIRYHINKLNTLIVLKDGDSWRATTETKPVEIRNANASGVIESSLFLAGKRAGLTDSLVMELAGIFGWDIDFILDIREGDSFTLIYEEKYVEGEKYANGVILAAEFVNQGKSFKAVRYT